MSLGELLLRCEPLYSNFYILKRRRTGEALILPAPTQTEENVKEVESKVCDTCRVLLKSHPGTPGGIKCLGRVFSNGLQAVLDELSTVRRQLRMNDKMHWTTKRGCPARLRPCRKEVTTKQEEYLEALKRIEFLEKEKNEVWCWSKANIDELRSATTSTNWAEVWKQNTLAGRGDLERQKSLILCSGHIPKRIVPYHSSGQRPWMTAAIRHEIQAKHRLFREVNKRSRLPAAWLAFKQQRNKVNSQIRKASQTSC